MPDAHQYVYGKSVEVVFVACKVCLSSFACEVVIVKSFVPPVGPRFVLNPIKVFEGSFGGATLYENPRYITPNTVSR